MRSEKRQLSTLFTLADYSGQSKGSAYATTLILCINLPCYAEQLNKLFRINLFFLCLCFFCKLHSLVIIKGFKTIFA